MVRADHDRLSPLPPGERVRVRGMHDVTSQNMRCLSSFLESTLRSPLTPTLSPGGRGGFCGRSPT
jgi:hypothetical protein